MHFLVSAAFTLMITLGDHARMEWSGQRVRNLHSDAGIFY